MLLEQTLPKFSRVSQRTHWQLCLVSEHTHDQLDRFRSSHLVGCPSFCGIAAIQAHHDSSQIGFALAAGGMSSIACNGKAHEHVHGVDVMPILDMTACGQQHRVISTRQVGTQQTARLTDVSLSSAVLDAAAWGPQNRLICHMAGRYMAGFVC